MNWITQMFAREKAPTAAKGPEPKAPGVVVSVERPQFGLTGGGAFPRQNLDDLAARKTLAIYAKMRLDEQVKAATTFKRDAIVSRGWTFEYPKDSKLSETERDLRLKVLNQCIEELSIGFVDALNVISTGRDFGFSLTEKEYTQIECDGKTYAGLASLLGRDPKTFNFYTDDFGKLIKCEQEVGGKKIAIDLEKFVHYVHNPEFDYYFGRSDLREAYRFWYFKDMMVRFWGIYMEKLGGGMMVATLSPDANILPGSPQYTALQSAVSEVKASAGVILPPGVTAEVVFPQSSDAFEKACTFADLAIAKALLVPNLMGISHTGDTGAYSQSQTQLETFAWTLQADTKRLEATVDKQIFRDLQDQNWGDKNYAQFRFKPLSDAKMQWLVDTWVKLTGAGAVLSTEDDEARLRELLEMPPRDPNAEPLVDPAATQAQEHELGKMDKEHEQSEEAKDNEAQRGIDTDKKRALDPVLAGEADKDRKAAIAKAKKSFGYNPDQERASDGKWSNGSGTPGPGPSDKAISRAQQVVMEKIEDEGRYYKTYTPKNPEQESEMRAKWKEQRQAVSHELKEEGYAIVSRTGSPEHGNTTYQDQHGNKIEVITTHGPTASSVRNPGESYRPGGSSHMLTEFKITVRKLNNFDRVDFGYNPDQKRDEAGRWSADGASERMQDHLDREMDAYATSSVGTKSLSYEDFKEVKAEAMEIISQEKLPDKVHPAVASILRDTLKGLKQHAGRDKRISIPDGHEANRLLHWLDKTEGKMTRHTVTPQQARIAIASARERVDFAVIERKASALESALAGDLALIVARAVHKELGDDESLKALTDQNTDDIGQVQLHPVAVGKLKVTTQKALVESWALGRDQAQREVRKSGKVTNIRFADLRDNAAGYFESTAFKVAGDVSDRARSAIQQELLTSVKVGRSPVQTRTAIWDRLVTLGLSSPEAVRSSEPEEAVISALDDLWKDTEEAAKHYLDTVARTNIFGAMNEARYAEFTDPALGDFVVALRYSAVLDERTTDICQALHGAVWRTDNELWNEYRPPNHFNCRSLLIPITAIDVQDGLWDGEESDEPSIEPQEGFGS